MRSLPVSTLVAETNSFGTWHFLIASKSTNRSMRSFKGLIAHQFLNWTKAHFYEIDATLKLIEKSMADLQADTKKQAEETLRR
jgi:hypothetical protein